MDDFKDINLSAMASETSEATSGVRAYKSQLYHMAKCAQGLFELLEDGDDLDDWAREGIMSSFELIEKVYKYIEYEKAFPSNSHPPLPGDEGDSLHDNNFLTNEDKRYPTPMEAEVGDQFVGRCIQDPNMKNRYEDQADRFMACMLIWNQQPYDPSKVNNPGEKFEDPMSSVEHEPSPIKPILP